MTEYFQFQIKEPKPVEVKNKAISCKPYMLTKGVSCLPHSCENKVTQTNMFLYRTVPIISASVLQKGIEEQLRKLRYVVIKLDFIISYLDCKNALVFILLSIVSLKYDVVFQKLL